jgi:hypothetical protein
MIDAGAFLTTTTAAGSGTSVPVADARYFFDGHGIPGELGDEVQLQGQAASARVVAVDVAAKRLTLDRPLTWAAGTGVALLFVGTSPDLGAFEAAGPTTLTLTVAKAGAGAGTVASSPAGISCGADCLEDYGFGTLVTLGATAAAGSTFVGWGGACTGTGACQLTMNAARSVSAVFEPNAHTLDVTIAGDGSGGVTSAPSGIDCGSDCNQTFARGTVVTLTALADAGSTFRGWAGACSGTSTCRVTMDSARDVRATFSVPHPGGFYTVVPCRVVDTRLPTGAYGGPALAAGSTRLFTLFGTCGIPSSARAVSLNVTVTQPTRAGNVRLYPAGIPVPLVSSLNYVAGITRANEAVVKLSAAGGLAVRCTQSSGTAHVILDVNGYFE